MSGTLLTTSQAAERLGVGKSTVNLWCRQGRFPNARSQETPRGPVWLIPEGDVKDFKSPQMGRPPKPKASGTDGHVTVKASKKGSKK
jgi:excisionase family DNA binding protein